MTATLYSRSVFLRGGGSRSCQPAASISSAPAEGADDGDVGRSDLARQRLAAGRHDGVGRLVAVDTAVVRRVADRGADVAAGLESRQAGGERRGRAAG